MRFNEFLQVLGPVPPATLAQRLAELEEAGVLERRVIDARPPRVEYRLTDARAQAASRSSTRSRASPRPPSARSGLRREDPA